MARPPYPSSSRTAAGARSVVKGAGQRWRLLMPAVTAAVSLLTICSYGAFFYEVDTTCSYGSCLLFGGSQYSIFMEIRQ